MGFKLVSVERYKDQKPDPGLKGSTRKKQQFQVYKKILKHINTSPSLKKYALPYGF